MMRQVSKKKWLLILANALLAVLVGLFSNVAAGVFTSLSPWIALAWVCVGTILIAVLSHWQERQQSSDPEMPETVAQNNRRIILKRVRNKWITGFLENELYYSYDVHLLPLPLRKRVWSRFDLVLSDPLESTHPIPNGTTITQLFDQAGSNLLILGEPGAGKTTLLLDLTRDLLKQAEDDEKVPIPVVLMLSSWSIKQLPLEQWIVEELSAKYDIARPVGEEWVKANQLCLLLDGLDEVAPSALPDCIKAINVYYSQAHSSLAVCCRTKKYQEQSSRLALYTAVTVQSLLFSEIDTYLDGLAVLGENTSGLKSALHQSEALYALATTPLFLSMLVLAYQGKPVESVLSLAATPPADQPERLCHNYVERLLQRAGTRLRATPQQTKYWLSWLACQLMQHQQTEFYLEDLQPKGLPEKQRTLYRWSLVLVIGLVVSLGLGLVCGLIGGLIYGCQQRIRQVESLAGSWKRVISSGREYATQRVWSQTSPQEGLELDDMPFTGGVILESTVFLGVKLLRGFGMVFVDVLGKKYQSIPHLEDHQPTPNQGIWRALKYGLFLGSGYGLVGGLIFELGFGFISGRGFGFIASGLVGDSISGLVGGSIFGFVVIGLGGLFMPTYKLFNRFISEFSISLNLPLQFVLFALLWLIPGLIRGLIFGLIGGLIFGLIFGLIGLIFGLIGGLGLGLTGGLGLGLFVGIVVGLDQGLGVFLQHFILRFWLWQARYTPAPWQYVAFLDDAVWQQFLCKVGGGYVFRHRLLQEYFASLETNRSSDGKMSQVLPISPYPEKP